MRITITTPLDVDFTFERLSAYEELGRPFRYDVYLLAPTRDVSLSNLLGELVTVHVEVSPQLTRRFGGYVMKAVSLGGYGRSARYHLELRPWLGLLQHAGTCRIWQDKTVLEVIKDVVNKAGFSLSVASQAILSGRRWEYLVQYRESDYNFIMRLLEQEGWYFYVNQTETNHDIVLIDDLHDHESAASSRRVRFCPPGGRHANVEDVLDHWTVNERSRTTHYELDEYEFKDARLDLFVRSGDPAKPAGESSNAEHEDRIAVIYDYPGEYATLDEGQKLSTVRQQELRVDRRTVVAQGNVRDLSVGSMFTLFDHPREDQNAKYAVTTMNLTLEAPAVESGVGRGDDFVFRGSYALLDARLPYRLKRISVKPSIPGLQTAVVVGPKSEEIHTDSYGRVRVKFRWDRTGTDTPEHENQGEEKAAPEDASCWIRVAQPWASSGFGFQFIPRVGDEVIVQFIEGDPDRPLITGSVYNSVNKLPYSLPANKTQSGVKTRSSKGGGADNANEIRFEDKKGEEDFFVQAERNHTVKVKKDRSVSVGGNESYSVTGTRDTTITKKNTDTYKDEHKMEVTKKVEEIFHDEHVLKVTNKQTIDVTNDVTEHITGNYKLTTDAQFLLTQGGTTMKFEGNAVDMNIAAPLTIVRGSGKVSIDQTGAITMESAVGIQFKCGGSTIELTPTGISVSAMTVLASAQTSELSLDPAQAKVSGTMVNVQATAVAAVTGATVKLN